MQRTVNVALPCTAPLGEAMPEVVAALLSARADPNAQDRGGFTPLDRATSAGCADAVVVLQAAVLFAAAQEGDIRMLTNVLEAGANSNARAKDGFTPLHNAAWRGRAETVAALLEAGANPNARDLSGGTPLHLAAQNGDAETVRHLLSAGADPNLRTNGKKTPLELWAGKRNDAFWQLNDLTER